MKPSAHKNGIVIIATGHSYYGRYAYNLAVSIKAVEDFPIAILYNGTALSHIGQHQIGIFDYVIEMDSEIQASQSSKLYAPLYTPFENSLLLDADTLWLPKQNPSELFESLKDVDFTSITEGKDIEPSKEYFFWADVGEIRQVYNTENTIYQWRTEVMYFNKKGGEILLKALEIVKNPRLKTLKMFAYKVPDELGINIACAINNIHPHIYKWRPSFWHLLNGGFIPEPTKLTEYYIISFGSNSASGTLKKVYDQIMRAACSKLGLNHVFPLHAKREFLRTERDKM